MDNSFDLERFVTAQNPIYEEVCAELRRGYKEGHWMWFIFPQLRGLGSSSMANKFGISSRAEAQAYLVHPILGPRLVECTDFVCQADAKTIEEIFGAIDSVKLRSSLTLFAAVAPDNDAFRKTLLKYFAGTPDRLTLDRI